MSEPVSSATVLAGGLMGASVFGLATGTDYGVVFGAFAGAVFMSPRQPISDASGWSLILLHYLSWECLAPG
ncbi:prophage membrane protein [Salmonella enterica]|uniref:Prophage membrane protein n=1 Tax=Salmonella enterica TaxID=28901 RepID=A0A379QNK4_SALER|nr:prophage membrane protein [Salmonella enterica]